MARGELESSEDGQVELAGTLKVGKKAADDDSPEPISVDKNGTVEVSHCSIGNFPPNKCGLTDGSFPSCCNSWAARWW